MTALEGNELICAARLTSSGSVSTVPERVDKREGPGDLPAATFEFTAEEKADEVHGDSYCNYNECYDEALYQAFPRSRMLLIWAVR